MNIDYPENASLLAMLILWKSTDRFQHAQVLHRKAQYTNGTCCWQLGNTKLAIK